MRTYQYLDHLDQAPRRIVLDMGHGVTMECEPFYGRPHDQVVQRWVGRFIWIWDHADTTNILILDDGTDQPVTPVLEA